MCLRKSIGIYRLLRSVTEKRFLQCTRIQMFLMNLSYYLEVLCPPLLYPPPLVSSGDSARQKLNGTQES